MKIQINSQKSFWITWEYPKSYLGRSLGTTICKIVDDSIMGKPFLVSSGEASCSFRDKFSKEVGRKVSLTRAIESLNLPKQERRIIWETYHSRKTTDPKNT